MEPTTMDEYIARREEVLGGEPIIEGPRTPVRAIVDEWRRGTPPRRDPGGHASSDAGTGFCCAHLL